VLLGRVLAIERDESTASRTEILTVLGLGSTFAGSPWVRMHEGTCRTFAMNWY
jgi:hypothetical protein